MLGRSIDVTPKRMSSGYYGASFAQGARKASDFLPLFDESSEHVATVSARGVGTGTSFRFGYLSMRHTLQSVLN